MSPQTPRLRRQAWTAAIALLVVSAVAITGLVVGSRLDPEPAPTPDSGSVDAGFARDMQMHHAQAVQMSVIVRERTENPEVRTLALDIQLTQQQQSGQMFAWLDLWGLPQRTSSPPMTWMQGAAGRAGSADTMDGMSGMSGSASTPSVADGQRMPGMATDEQLDQLRRSTGTDAERLFLQLMIPHHQGGVMMAQYAATRAESPDVRRLAQTMVDSQTAEITAMQQMLADRGGPLPSS